MKTIKLRHNGLNLVLIQQNRYKNKTSAGIELKTKTKKMALKCPSTASSLVFLIISNLIFAFPCLQTWFISRGTSSPFVPYSVILLRRAFPRPSRKFKPGINAASTIDGRFCIKRSLCFSGLLLSLRAAELASTGDNAIWGLSSFLEIRTFFRQVKLGKKPHIDNSIVFGTHISMRQI